MNFARGGLEGMYKVDNVKTGKYLDRIIKKKYEKSRHFAIEYVKLKDGVEPSNESITRAANKISQIQKGNKGLQLEDLPIFAELLEVSVDSILSGGEAPSPSFSRMTNYTIAFSQNEEEWEAYIHHPDKPFLNPDEYGKTVIDYALEYKNYAFLKYLMDKEYIWFAREEQGTYQDHFGAGTRIDRRNFYDTDLLGTKLREKDQLRTDIIALALEKRDFSVLDRMKAREVPSLYYAKWFLSPPLDFKRYKNPDYIDFLSGCDERVLNFFSEEFTIVSDFRKECTFIFPYLGELLDLAIKKKNKAAVKAAENALLHNRNVLKQIKEIAAISAESLSHLREYGEDVLANQVMHHFNFCKENDTVCFRSDDVRRPDFQGIFSNVIKVTEESSDAEINALIKKINDTYRQIADYTYKEKQV
jgi:hypothetical protein